MSEPGFKLRTLAFVTSALSTMLFWINLIIIFYSDNFLTRAKGSLECIILEVFFTSSLSCWTVPHVNSQKVVWVKCAAGFAQFILVRIVLATKANVWIFNSGLDTFPLNNMKKKKLYLKMFNNLCIIKILINWKFIHSM